MSPAARRTTIFTKEPVPGTVKTRLVPPLSPEQAARLADAMLADTVDRSLSGGGLGVELAVAPADAVAGFRARFPTVARVVAQRGEGLAERLANHFDEVCDSVGSGVVLGGDAPQIEPELVVDAHLALERGTDLVLGPDQGGGYYLIGLRRACPALFREVPMSTGSMCAETVSVARRAGLSVELLARRYDIDHPTDLERLERELLSGPTPDQAFFPFRTARLLAQWREPKS